MQEKVERMLRTTYAKLTSWQMEIQPFGHREHVIACHRDMLHTGASDPRKEALGRRVQGMRSVEREAHCAVGGWVSAALRRASMSVRANANSGPRRS